MKSLNLTQGSIIKSLLLFSLPIMVGNLLQQFYNIADTLIVGRYLGTDALAAVGSSYTLMTFLTSILLGLCMGSGALLSIRYGENNIERLKATIFTSFILIAAVTLLLNVLAFCGIDLIIQLLQVPASVVPDMRDYLWIIFMGIGATFLYNYFAALLRAIGNSIAPLLFLGISAVLNIFLDLFFILSLGWGVSGAAAANVLAQFLSGIGLSIYTLLRFPELRFSRRHMHWNPVLIKELTGFSLLTCAQQSIMNFGILIVQGLVNQFGPAVMAAFAAAVKIDSFAYMPVQDFGNAFSTFVAQNYGAQKIDRIRRGTHCAATVSLAFCLVISATICIFSGPLMQIFIHPSEHEIIAIGVQYLWIEGSCYVGIGLLFLLYGFYRAVKRPGMSVILTAVSLGTRVLLAYLLSAVSFIGVIGIWVAVPIGWFLADGIGLIYYCKHKNSFLSSPDY